MSDGDKDQFDDRVLGLATGVDAPPPAPSAELLRAVEGGKPVRTRSRFGAAAVVALLGLVGPAIALVHGPLRRDLGALPVAWVIAAAGLWGAAFALSLAAAMIPRRGDVLPAPGRASLVAAAAVAVVGLFALFATVDVPGVSMLPAERGWTLMESCVHCIGTIAKIAAVVLVAGLVALRRLVPVGGSRIGMALGAAGGAMGGLLLVFICPFATTAHVVGGHVAGMVLAAIAGAVLMRVTARYALALALLALMLAAGCAGSTAAGPATSAASPSAAPAAEGLLFGTPDGADGEALRNAVRQMDDGKVDKSIAALEDLHRKYPRNATVLHELTLAHRLAHQPRRAVELLLPYQAQLPPLMLSALGSALDEAGDAAQAESVLREGLKRNPKAGVLYSDLGTTLRGAGRPKDALDAYLQGTAAEPTFPGNYRRAAEIYAQSDHRALALVYGEMFRLLDPARSNKTAELMVTVYREAVSTTGSGKNAQTVISLAPKQSGVEVGADGSLKSPLIALPLAIELSIGPALVDAHKQGLSLASLHKARAALVAAMAKPDGPFKDHKLPLLPWLAALYNAGHLEAYDHWLYGPAFPDEMKSWGVAHRKQVDAMTKWAEDHPLFWQ
ncbi:MAG TPA: NrsF family protein [Polyangia bacterium]|jgi:tetratricopeptide (TPR) repeat protein|nr:NrsF family protein [Polyangia bacterium]